MIPITLNPVLTRIRLLNFRTHDPPVFKPGLTPFSNQIDAHVTDRSQ